MSASLRRLAPMLACGAGVLALTGCGGGGGSAVEVWIEPGNFSTRPVTTPAPAAEAQPTATDADGRTRSTSSQSYTIRPNDNASAIAQRFDVELDALVGINDWESAGAAQLYPGNTIQIPPNGLVVGSGSGSSSADDDEADTAEETDSGDGESSGGAAGTCEDGSDAETYEIVANDNPSKVAEAQGVTLQELRDANEGSSVMDSFIVGQEIFLPC